MFRTWTIRLESVQVFPRHTLIAVKRYFWHDGGFESTRSG
ncbi:hypothetical protein WG66_011577 [Moniliophthora roreri]|nr:hypothetical protein WG66_011577 [Moniliophthora roreri]